MSDILQRLIAHPESFSIPEIQHGVEDGTIPALAGMMAIQAIQKRQAGAQAHVGPQPTVASSMGINMLPTNDTMPQGMAGGGIVAFAGDTDGSLVKQELDPLKRWPFGGQRIDVTPETAAASREAMQPYYKRMFGVNPTPDTEFGTSRGNPSISLRGNTTSTSAASAAAPELMAQLASQGIGSGTQVGVDQPDLANQLDKGGKKGQKGAPLASTNVSDPYAMEPIPSMDEMWKKAQEWGRNIPRTPEELAYIDAMKERGEGYKQRIADAKNGAIARTFLAAAKAFGSAPTMGQALGPAADAISKVAAEEDKNLNELQDKSEAARLSGMQYQAALSSGNRDKAMTMYDKFMDNTRDYNKTKMLAAHYKDLGRAALMTAQAHLDSTGIMQDFRNQRLSLDANRAYATELNQQLLKLQQKPEGMRTPAETNQMNLIQNQLKAINAVLAQQGGVSSPGIMGLAGAQGAALQSPGDLTQFIRPPQ